MRLRNVNVPEHIFRECHRRQPVNQDKPTIDLFLIVQSIIVLMFCATTCYLFITQQAIPDLLQIVATAIVSVFITSRAGASSMRQSAQAVAAVMQAVERR